MKKRIDEVDFYLEDLRSKFRKLKNVGGYDKYYLSYSGGKDSHLLYWFIKEYTYPEFKDIEIVGINTYMEHHEIRDRILKNCDIVLYPKMKPMEIKAKYGIPCFSKEQDFYIYYYQNAIRKGKKPSKTIQEKIDGTYKTGFCLSKKAREYVKSNKAHKITHLCCHYLKKEPARRFEKETGLKPILGIRSNESMMRKQQYKSCFTKDKKFTPLHDLSDELLDKIYKKYNIEIPKVYNYISRTGCSGCWYGSWKGDTKKELLLITDNQFNFVCDYFKESYDVLGIPVETISTLRNQIKNNEITLEEAITIISTCKY